MIKNKQFIQDTQCYFSMAGYPSFSLLQSSVYRQESGEGMTPLSQGNTLFHMTIIRHLSPQIVLQYNFCS